MTSSYLEQRLACWRFVSINLQSWQCIRAPERNTGSLNAAACKGLGTFRQRFCHWDDWHRSDLQFEPSVILILHSFQFPSHQIRPRKVSNLNKLSGHDWFTVWWSLHQLQLLILSEWGGQSFIPANNGERWGLPRQASLWQSRHTDSKPFTLTSTGNLESPTDAHSGGQGELEKTKKTFWKAPKISRNANQNPPLTAKDCRLYTGGALDYCAEAASASYIWKQNSHSVWKQRRCRHVQRDNGPEHASTSTIDFCEKVEGLVMAVTLPSLLIIQSPARPQ